MNEPTKELSLSSSAHFSEFNYANPVLEFEHLSTWFLIIVGGLTLGIYNVYWLFSRGQLANKLTQKHKINVFILYSYLAISIFSFGSILSTLTVFTGILQLLALVIFLLLIFPMKRSIEEIINAGQQNHQSLSSLLTLFGSSIYFQYKINQAIELQCNR